MTEEAVEKDRGGGRAVFLSSGSVVVTQLAICTAWSCVACCSKLYYCFLGKKRQPMSDEVYSDEPIKKRLICVCFISSENELEIRSSL